MSLSHSSLICKRATFECCCEEPNEKNVCQGLDAWYIVNVELMAAIIIIIMAGISSDSDLRLRPVLLRLIEFPEKMC